MLFCPLTLCKYACLVLYIYGNKIFWPFIFTKIAIVAPCFETHDVFSAALQLFVKLRDKIAFFLKGQNRNFLKVKETQMHLSQNIY